MLSHVQNICKMTVHICSYLCFSSWEHLFSVKLHEDSFDSIYTSQYFHNRIEAIIKSLSAKNHCINFPTCIQRDTETIYLVHRALSFTLNLCSIIIPLLLSWLFMSRRCQHTTQNNTWIIPQTHVSIYKMDDQPFQIKSFKFLFISQCPTHV